MPIGDLTVDAFLATLGDRTPTLTGSVFRYMPWTSPRKRLFGLAVAAALMLVAALGLLFDQG